MANYGDMTAENRAQAFELLVANLPQLRGENRKPSPKEQRAAGIALQVLLHNMLSKVTTDYAITTSEVIANCVIAKERADIESYPIQEQCAIVWKCDKLRVKLYLLGIDVIFEDERIYKFHELY
jgi:hypothetical protein